MAGNNNTDIQLIAGLDESYSEAEIRRVIKLIEKRLRANNDATIKLKAEIANIDDSTIKNTIDKLQSLLKSKDLKIDTQDSIRAITREANAMMDVVDAAKKASVEKIAFMKANERLRDSAEDSVDAINRERTAMQSLDDVDDIMNNICNSGREGASVFQRWGNSLRDALSAYTTLNLFEKSLEKMGEAGEKAIEIVRDLNGEIVDLRMSTGESYAGAKQLLSDYNSLGQELGAITQDVSSAASDWLRQGYNVEDTNELIRSSMMLSKISQIDSASATEYLTSSMKGYHVAVEDVVGIVDKLCSVDMAAAVSADGLANGMSRVSGVAESAGVSMDKLLGYLAVVGETTQQSMSSVGTALRTIFLRMQDIKTGKLELIDEDGTVELLSDVETTLKNVGIDLRATVNEFNNSGDVLDSLAKKWDTLSSVQQAALGKAFSGQRQGNMFRVLMENYETASKYMDIATQSTGMAEEKFGYYLESLESKTNSLIASLQNLATTTIPDSLYASVLDTSKAIVDTTTETGLLKGALMGLSTAGSLYAFSQIAMYVREAAQGFADLSEAMDLTRSGTVVMGDMQRLIDLTSGLSQSQTRLLLSTNNLDDAQRIAILTQQNLAQGMNREVAEATARATLNTWGLNTATVSLSGVMRGLLQSIRANPLFLVASAVSALTMVYHNHNQKLEETKQKNLEASEKAIDYANSLKDLSAEYTRLSSIQDKTSSQEEEYKTVLAEITEKLGDKASALEGLTAGTNEYAEALANLTKEELQSASVEATIGRKAVEDDFKKDIWSDLKGSKVTVDSNSKGKALSDEAQKAVDIVSESLKEFETINRSWNNLSWDITSDNPEEALDYYNAMVKAREALVLASEDDEALLETEVYKDLNSAITAMSDSLDEYIEKRYEEEKLNYMAQNGIPQTVEEYEAMKEAMDKTVESSEGLKSRFNDLLSSDFSNLATSVQKVAETGENLSDNISSFNYESFNDTIQFYEEGYNKLISAQDEWNQAKSLSAETFANLQENGLLQYIETTSEGLTVNKEKLLENAQASKEKAIADLHAAMMSDMLKIALGNVDTVSEQAKSVIAQLGDNTETAGKQAINSVAEWATLGATITDVMAQARGEDRGFNGVSDEQKKQMEAVYDYYNDLAGKISKIDITTPARTSGSSKQTEKEVDIMAELNSEMDEYQSKLEAVQKARETYNEYGKITVDQAQEILDADFKLLAAYGSEEEALERLGKAKLNEMQIQLARNALDTINSITSEAMAADYLAGANENLAKSYASVTEEMLKNAAARAKERGELQGQAADTILKGYQNGAMMLGQVDFGFNLQEAEKSKKEQKTMLDIFNEERRYLEHLQKMDKINNKEFYERLKELAEKYLKGNEEYKDELWGIEEEVYDYYESIKKDYNWIENLLDSISKKVSSIVDKIDKFYSWQKKNLMINRAVKEMDKEITQNQNAYNFYMDKANSVGLGRKYINKIQNGELNIETISDEELSEKIEKYEEWYL